MRCPYCNAQVKDGIKFCTECGATLNYAAVQREEGERIAVKAGSGAMALGAAAREMKWNEAVSEDQIISARGYNAIMMGVLIWGLLLNVLLCFTVGSVYRFINPIIFTVLYFICAIGGILINKFFDKPLLSFLGYNMVVVPFGLVISTLVEAYGGPYSEEVAYAFLYTLVITLGMTGAALAFPRLFEKLGGALLGVLLGLILCEVVLMIIGVSQSVTDWVAAGLFSLYIGVDVYRSQQAPKTVDNAVDSALDIYLDIANLFLRILVALAKKDD